MTNTPISTITSPTTRTAYCATAMAELGTLISSTPSSRAGRPGASCHARVAAFLSFFRFLLAPVTASSVTSLLSDTIDHDAPAPAGVSTGAAAGSGLGGATGSKDSTGAGLQTSCCGAGAYGDSGGANVGGLGSGAAGGGGPPGAGVGGPASPTGSGPGGGTGAGPARGAPPAGGGGAALASLPRL